MTEGLPSTSPTIGLGDAMLMCNGNRNYDGYNNMYNNPFFLLIFLAMFGNGNYWGNRNDGANLNTAAIESAKASLQSSIYASNDQQTLMEMIRGINYGLADVGYAMNNAVKDSAYATQNAINNGFNNVGQTLNNGFDKVFMGLSENRFSAAQNTNALQRDICATNHNIDNLRYDNAQNTSRLETAMHNEGEATRALIAHNAMQDLRDKLAAQSQELQNAKFALSQQEQNAVLISALKGNCGCGCGCGCVA